MKGWLLSLGMFGALLAGMVAVSEITMLLLSQLDVPASMEGAASFTSIGFAIWYGWYVTTKAIPRIIDQHGVQIERIEASHSKRVEQLSSDFREELRAARESFRCEKG